MTKSTSPADSNAGLPVTNRRSLVCGLAATAIAGVPVMTAGAAPKSDPVFEALAALDGRKFTPKNRTREIRLPWMPSSPP